jgi:hypothetical protein
VSIGPVKRNTGDAPVPITPDRIIRLGYAFRESKALLSAV